MSNRAIPPLFIAIAAGFMLGLIAAVNEFGDSTIRVIGVVGAIVVAILGLLSPLGRSGGAVDQGSVGLLRAGTSVGCFVFLYAGMIDFLKLGHIGLGLAWWVVAAAFAALSTRLRVRGREAEPEAEPGEAAAVEQDHQAQGS